MPNYHAYDTTGVLVGSWLSAQLWTVSINILQYQDLGKTGIGRSWRVSATMKGMHVAERGALHTVQPHGTDLGQSVQ